jgi:hypothetical protein
VLENPANLAAGREIIHWCRTIAGCRQLHGPRSLTCRAVRIRHDPACSRQREGRFANEGRGTCERAGVAQPARVAYGSEVGASGAILEACVIGCGDERGGELAAAGSGTMTTRWPPRCGAPRSAVHIPRSRRLVAGSGAWSMRADMLARGSLAVWRGPTLEGRVIDCAQTAILLSNCERYRGRSCTDAHVMIAAGRKPQCLTVRLMEQSGTIKSKVGGGP